MAARLVTAVTKQSTTTASRFSRSNILWPGARRIAVALIGVALLSAACSSGDEPNADNPAGDMTDITHQLEPTDQMRQAATQQCLDDPDLAVGYIRAVDPATGAQLAEIEIDCSTVERGDN